MQDGSLPNKTLAHHLKQSLTGTPLCRKEFFDHDSEHEGRLGGENHVVKIDKAKFGKRKYNRGRRVEGRWVFGGTGRTTRQTFLIPVERRAMK